LPGGAEWIAEPELLSEAERVIEPEALDEPQLLSEAEMIVEAEAQAGFESPAPPELVVEPELQIEVELTEKAPPLAGVYAAIEPPPKGFEPAAAPPSLRLADGDHERAWELLLQSKELYERKEFAKAVPLLKKAIKLESGQGDFYYLLGLCQSEAELTKNEAEMNLKKAIELKSWSADPVYALGVLYRGQGKMKLAERCFQRVKEISYEHTGASRALVDLRRRKAGLPLKKKKS
jgi:tetratricopeptide (TPR) repeat protein